jgi:hypothetical protein
MVEEPPYGAAFPSLGRRHLRLHLTAADKLSDVGIGKPDEPTDTPVVDEMLGDPPPYGSLGDAEKQGDVFDVTVWGIEDGGGTCCHRSILAQPRR